MTHHKTITISKEEFDDKKSAKKYERYTAKEEAESGIRPDGSIDLSCPCMHSALSHRCGHFFRLAIRCFNGSTTKPKGNDCLELFKDHAICIKHSS
uniref:SWIM-type domain-containing protein n=1 Tax=Steinernema glaseri TaxID=37863 RepID=A0A1I8A9M8_9BILA